MILDRFLAYSLNQNLAQVAGTYDSDILDFGITSGIPTSANGGGARDMGIGDDPSLKLLVQITTTFTGGTNLIVTLKGAIDDGTGNPAAFSSWWSSPTYLLATMNAGSRLMDMDFPRPPDGVAIPRFSKLSYITTGTFTAGNISSFVVIDRMDQPYSSTDNSVLGGYQAGINVAN